MTEPLLEMRDVCKGFPGVQALASAHLTVERGEVMALVGENGAGKSTMMKILAGVYAPDSGTILMNGQEVHPRDPMYCLLYTSDAADDLLCVDLGGRRIITKKKD